MEAIERDPTNEIFANEITTLMQTSNAIEQAIDDAKSSTKKQYLKKKLEKNKDKTYKMINFADHISKQIAEEAAAENINVPLPTAAAVNTSNISGITPDMTPEMMLQRLNMQHPTPEILMQIPININNSPADDIIEGAFTEL